MKFNNYIINGKPLGFTSDVLGQIVQEVLGSYLPIKPTTCMFTGKPILTKPRITFIDNNPENILFSNIAVVGEVDMSSSFQHEVVFDFPHKGISIKCWKFEGFDYFNENNLNKISKYISSLDTDNPIQIFLDLINEGVKGLIYVNVKKVLDSITLNEVRYVNNVTESCHYQDIIKYRMQNPTNIVSPIIK